MNEFDFNTFIQGLPTNRVVRVPPIRTGWGNVISIGASPAHQCNPKNFKGPYKTVEVYVIQGSHNLYKALKPYWNAGIAEYVPVEVVNEIVGEGWKVYTGQ